LALAALVALVMNALGAFNVLRSEALALIGLPGIALGFLVPQSVSAESARLILAVLVWGGSFMIWLGIAYAAIILTSRRRHVPVA
jgi:hypothetical protein